MNDTRKSEQGLIARAARVRLLAMDCDGVMTDGSINLDDTGVETKRFNVRDGFGLRLWQELGLHAAIITGRTGGVIEHRSRELRIAFHRTGVVDKAAALREVAEELGLDLAETAYLGDDWPDLRVMRACGYPMAVADAEAQVRGVAAYITTRAGGHGAVREVVEHLLAAKGMMEQAAAKYDGPITEDEGS